MLRIVSDQRNKRRLALICDYCQTEITDAELALYACRIRRNDSRIADGKIYFLHKGVCDHATTDSDNDHEKSLYRWYWDELSNLPRKLISSLGMTFETAQGIVREVTEENMHEFRDAGFKIEQEVEEWRKSAESENWTDKGD